MLIKRNFLCCAGAQHAARLMSNGQSLPAELESHQEAAEYILSAIAEGWFMLPYWLKSGSYSREQFGEIHRHLEKHPDLPDAIRVAEAAVDHAKATFNGPLFELFGSRLKNRLPDPVVMAKIAHLSCPRKPFEFAAWEFTADDFCNLMDDLTARCRHIHQLAAVITRPGMLDASACLASKIDHLRAIGRPDWISAIVNSAHYSYLSPAADAELRKVVAGHGSGHTFTDFVTNDRQAKEAESQASWRATKSMIRNVAAVLAEAKSYHQATLTKLLRRDLGRHFGIRTVHHLQGMRLVVATDTHHELGSNSKIETPFELVNWVIALDNAISKCTNDVYGYWEACKNADSALERMRGEVA